MDQINIKKDTDLNLIHQTLIRKSMDGLKLENQEIFKTSITKAITQNQILQKILEAIQVIDFEQFIDDEPDQTFGKNNKKKRVNDEDKAVAIIDNLLQVASSINSGVGTIETGIIGYNGFYWDEINPKIFKVFLGKVAHKSGYKILKAFNRRTNEILFETFLILAPLFKPTDMENSIKINLLNGCFCIKIKENKMQNILKPVDKDDLFLYQLPFIYDPNAEAPQFEKYLDMVLPDKDAQNVLLEYCGYIFTDHLKLERILILYGSGANGKSVFFDILRALLGDDNISYFSMNKLCDESGYSRAVLPGKLLNYASEFGGKLDIQIFKRLISNEPVEARHPYGQPFVIKDYCKFIFNANKLPEVEHTDAFFRRPIIIPFNKKIKDSEKDIHLAKKIIGNELSGIFNLILKGLERLLKNGDFSNSKLLDLELANYRKDSNTIALFLEEENWIPSTEIKMRAQELFNQYKEYCRECNVKFSFSYNNFLKKLEELGYAVKRKGTNNYTEVFCKKKGDSAITLDPKNFTDLLSIFKIK